MNRRKYRFVKAEMGRFWWFALIGTTRLRLPQAAYKRPKEWNSQIRVASFTPSPSTLPIHLPQFIHHRLVSDHPRSPRHPPAPLRMHSWCPPPTAPPSATARRGGRPRPRRPSSAATHRTEALWRPGRWAPPGAPCSTKKLGFIDVHPPKYSNYHACLFIYLFIYLFSYLVSYVMLCYIYISQNIYAQVLTHPQMWFCGLCTFGFVGLFSV